MSNFLSIIKHLLPSGKAWRLTADKTLRKFFDGLAGYLATVRTFIDLAWLDLLPAYTREIPLWENNFGLPHGNLNEAQRRARIAAAWSALGGQSPRYIQDTLQANGFDVYVHEWWEIVGGLPVARDPLSVIAPDNITPIAGKGYPLVNKIPEIVPDIIPCCGEAEALCDEPRALCLNYISLKNRLNRWYITNIMAFCRPYYLYIGGEVFGGMVSLPASRRDEFENLCLKICPTQQWLGILVNYV